MKEGREYAILTNDITTAWAGRSVKDYSTFLRQPVSDGCAEASLIGVGISGKPSASRTGMSIDLAMECGVPELKIIKKYVIK